MLQEGSFSSFSLLLSRRALLFLFLRKGLNPKIGVQELRFGFKLTGLNLLNNMTVFHDVMTVGNGGGKTEVLLHQQDGQAPLLELDQYFAQRLHNDRRQ